MNNKNTLNLALISSAIAIVGSFFLVNQLNGADRRIAHFQNRQAQAATSDFAPKLVGRVLIFNGVSKVKDLRIPKGGIIIFSVVNPDQARSQIQATQVADDTIVFSSLEESFGIGPTVTFSVYSRDNAYDEFD